MLRSGTSLLGSASMSLEGKVALVAGATRGAGRGIAIELGAAGATVYATGRTTRAQRSEYGRPETIEETADLIAAAGGRAIAVQVDHLVADRCGRWWSASAPSRAASTSWSTTSGAARS
jgi:NAD(P)-dependent dehydrogenase (short-subunit alcohol dehydrogenase family)